MPIVVLIPDICNKFIGSLFWPSPLEIIEKLGRENVYAELNSKENPKNKEEDLNNSKTPSK